MGMGFRGWCCIDRTTPGASIYASGRLLSKSDRRGWCWISPDPCWNADHCIFSVHPGISSMVSVSNCPGRCRFFGIYGLSSSHVEGLAVGM